MKFNIGEYVMVDDDTGYHSLTGKCRIIGVELMDAGQTNEYIEYKVFGAQRGNPTGRPFSQRLLESEMTKI